MLSNPQCEVKEVSVSNRIKKSLDKMYKTTKSINSSEEKSKSFFNNTYTKIVLDNGYYYEG